jgi:hypothetical protein
MVVLFQQRWPIEIVHPLSLPSREIYDYITIGLSGVRRGIGAEIIGIFGDKTKAFPGAFRSHPVQAF